jgi:NAD(P)-dependent dehydrogenase (short-subunit alcohol dehydrogenase family)
MAARAEKDWGPVDILVNNAGVLRDETFAKMDVADFEFVLRVHLMARPIALRPSGRACGSARVSIPRAKPGALGCGPLKAVGRVADAARELGAA